MNECCFQYTNRGFIYIHYNPIDENVTGNPQNMVYGSLRKARMNIRVAAEREMYEPIGMFNPNHERCLSFGAKPQ